VFDYEALRLAHRPESVSHLLVAESAPHPGRGPVRFFYDSTLYDPPYDMLFRCVAAAAYPGIEVGRDASKGEVLQHFKRDGIWLIDAASEPINHLKGKARREAQTATLPSLLSRCQSIDPTAGVLICLAKFYDQIHEDLAEKGVRVFPRRLKFPRADHPEWQVAFIAGVRAFLQT
jgi:hypothetical protein